MQNADARMQATSKRELVFMVPPSSMGYRDNAEDNAPVSQFCLQTPVISESTPQSVLR
jgi:hypothetical protein